MRGIDGIFITHAHQINVFLASIKELFEIPEHLFAAIVLDKIVARSARIAAHRCVFKSYNAVDDLVERSVTAAGIKAHGIFVLGAILANVRRCIPRCLGFIELVIDLYLFQLQDLFNVFKGIILAGRGVDDENMFHNCHFPFLCLFVLLFGALLAEMQKGGHKYLTYAPNAEGIA